MANNKKNNKKTNKSYLPVNLPLMHMQEDQYDLGGALKDVGKGLLNAAVTPLEAAVGVNFYDPKMETNVGVGVTKGLNAVQKVGAAVTPTIANTILPGSGAAIQAAQMIGQQTLNDNTQQGNSLGQNFDTGLGIAAGVGQMVTPFIGGGIGQSGTPVMQKNGGYMKYDDGGKIYTKDPNDPRLKAYNASLQANKYLDKYTSVLDNLSKVSDLKQRQKLINDQWYNTKDAMDFDNLVKTHNLNVKGTGKQIDAGDYQLSYERVFHPEVILGDAPAAPVVTPTTPEANTTVAPQGDFQYKKQFKGFHDPSMQGTGYGVDNFQGTMLPKMELGGKLPYNEFNGNKHEEGGIPLGQNAEVEDGEVRVADYIFSDSLKPQNSDHTFAELAKRINKKYGRRENDAPSNRAMNKELEQLMFLNEQERMAKEEQDAIQGQEDFMKYGGYLEMKNGGIFIKPENRGKFTRAAKERGMGVQEFANHVLAHKDKYSSTMVKRANFAHNASRWKHADGGLMENPEADFPRDAFGNILMHTPQPQPMDLTDVSGLQLRQENSASQVAPDSQNKKSDIFDPNAKFGAKELGYIASNLPGMYNLMKGANPEETQFERFNPENVDLSGARELMNKQAALASAQNRTNIRNNATSSGQALANLAAGNASINSNLQDQILQSLLQEKMANANINNQAGQLNTNISIQENIANAQNRAMADSMIGLGLSDIGMNTQGYFRDKGLQKENTRMNNQNYDLINNLFANYKWGVDPQQDKLMIQFLPK
jgi:hypothetical protein